MSVMRSLLLIDDNPRHAEAFRAALHTATHGPFKAHWARTLSQGLERLREGVWAIVANLYLPDSQGLDTFNKLLQSAPRVPILVLAGAEDEDIAAKAMQGGAKDYLLEGHIDSHSFARAIRSVAERQVAEEALFTEKERARVTLNSIGDAVVNADVLGNITSLNAVAERMTGWTCGDASGKQLDEVFRTVDDSNRTALTNPLELEVKGNNADSLTANCILIRRDGKESDIEKCAAPIYDRLGLIAGTVIAFHDVSASRTMSLEMSHLTHHDPLTDLPNRLLLKDRLSQAIEAARRNDTKVAVLFLDLDGFKHINDSLGHAIGDKLLRSVALRLVGGVRSSDTVGRQGGDEFVVVLADIKQAADAGSAARGVLTALAASFPFDPHDLRITASIGLSMYPEDGEDAETMMKNADTAMYQAKVNGPNNYQFFKKFMNVRAIERQSVEADLHRALERHEFFLNYQPKVNLVTGEIAGGEALIRWVHPDRGLVSPDQFIPIAEDCGLILPIGHWVLTEACRQVREWMDSGLRIVPVAVNVSSLELRSEGFLEGLRVIVKNSRLDPRHLDLELTETALMRHAGPTVALLKDLKSIGVHLSLDDFGTGYSSLRYLKWIPIDTLKIDQSFVQSIATDPGDATLVSTMITMAKGLKKRVVGEGVETEEQMTFLQALGCDEAQGHYFSKPVAAKQFAKLLEKRAAPFFIPCFPTLPFPIDKRAHISRTAKAH